MIMLARLLHIFRDTASRPYGPPALRWGALNAGQAWVLGSYAPKGPAELDYEREKSLFRAVSGQDVAFDSCDLGTFEELKERVNEYMPHILHLTGHGVVRDGKGHFAFEKEDGTAERLKITTVLRCLQSAGEPEMHPLQDSWELQVRSSTTTWTRTGS